MGPCIVIYFYSKTNWMHKFMVYWISLYMFRTVFPSIIRSSRLYIDHQVYVIQVSWLLASGHEMELNIYLMLYVQSWTPDDGWKDRPKHVEWYSINSKNCASSWFYYRNKTNNCPSNTTTYMECLLYTKCSLYMYSNICTNKYCKFILNYSDIFRC